MCALSSLYSRPISRCWDNQHKLFTRLYNNKVRIFTPVRRDHDTFTLHTLFIDLHLFKETVNFSEVL